MTYRLSDEDREALYRAGDHHPDICDCSAYVIEQAFAEDDCCGALLDTFAVVEAIVNREVAALLDDIEAGIEGAKREHQARGNRCCVAALSPLPGLIRELGESR